MFPPSTLLVLLLVFGNTTCGSPTFTRTVIGAIARDSAALDTSRTGADTVAAPAAAR